MEFQGTPADLKRQICDGTIQCVSQVFKAGLPTKEMITAALDGLMERTLMPAEDATYPNGKRRETGCPTLHELDQMDFLHALGHNPCAVFQKPTDEMRRLVYGRDTHVFEARYYPKARRDTGRKYLAKVFREGKTTHWSREKLKKEGGFSEDALDWFRKDHEPYGFELYFDEEKKKVAWRTSKSHDPAAYAAHLKQVAASFDPLSEPSRG